MEIRSSHLIADFYSCQACITPQCSPDARHNSCETIALFSRAIMSVPPSDAEDSHLLDGPDTPAKANAPKNKECPFCGEKFTSSSLGRHLDLYIKEKNPKAPDGLHDVDRIRQIRSHITRRQPRKGTKQHTVSTPGSNVDGHVNTTASAYGYTIGTDKDNRILINRPTWEATGVITDIPTTPGASLNLTSRKQISRTNMVLKKRMVEDRTRLRAAELALQEILDSVNAARLICRIDKSENLLIVVVSPQNLLLSTSISSGKPSQLFVSNSYHHNL